MNPLGLYIHIPFCRQKCDYCDFLSFAETPQTTKDLYIEALCHELEALGASFTGRKLTTIYIGGGTPSVLSKDNFETLMTRVKASFQIEEGAEITMEMNPGTVTEEKLHDYKAMGINRVSMGLQSDDDAQLKELGRIHSYAMYEKTYALIRKSGIDNINVDVMFGLHNQTMAQWQQTLKTVIDLAPEHISAYSLTIEPDTVYETRYDQDGLNLPDDDTERAMFWYAHDTLEAAGYGHYEISNYAKEGKISKHNSSYWNLTDYIGAGLGASSFYGNVRYKNITGFNSYLEAKGALSLVRVLEQVNDEATNLEEAFFLGLRKLKGLSLKELKQTYGEAQVAPYEQVIDELVAEGLLIKEGPTLRLTRRGTDISNQVMSRFLL